MRLFLLLLLFTAVCPALAADADVKAATVAYVNHEVLSLSTDIRNEVEQDYLTKEEAKQTYATPQDVQDAVNAIDHSGFLTSAGGTVTGVLNVPTPTLPTE